MNIFFDLDGTLIDSRPRMYQLFQNMVPTSKLTFDEYWYLKKNKICHEAILRRYFDYDEDQIRKFLNEWLAKIELPEWLKIDKLYPGAKKYLSLLSNDSNLYIITSRQFEDLAKNQIDKLGIFRYFKSVFVANKKTKQDLIKEFVVTSSEDWVVGDTGKDIEVGKSLGLKTAAVLSGFLNREKLLDYDPDVIVDSVTSFNFSR